MIGMTMCSGIGAPEIAAPWIDWRFASEIEPFPRAVLQERFGYRLPDNHNQGEPLLWGDMTEITPDLLRSRGIPLPDLIVAGTPCQAFSVAGARKGLADARGNLTLAFVEICHAIVAARPDGRLAVLWENVPGVLSDSGNAFGCFLGGLVGAVDALPPPADGSWPGEGMVQGPRARAAWAVLDAQWFGVAQRRKRVFVVVDFGNCVDPAAVLLEPDRLRGDSPPRREAGQRPAPTVSARTKGGGGLGTDFDCDGGLIPSVSLCLNAGAMGRIDGESETFIPVAAPVADSLTVGANQTTGFIGEVVAHTLKGEGFDASEDGTGRQNLIPESVIGFPWQMGSAINMPIDTDGSIGTLVKNQTQAVAFAIQERASSENPGAGPDGAGFRQDDAAYTLEARPVTQAVAFGCGVDTTGHQGDKAFAPGDVWTTLSAQSGNNGGGGGGILSLPRAVRRLMPVETARLQGFPDDHTAITYRGKPAADGPQYKAHGNSMAVPVIAYILQRMHISMTGRAAA